MSGPTECASGQTITFLSEIRPEDFVQPRALWERVFDDAARERFINSVAGHMKTCRAEEVVKHQIAIFREMPEDLASRLENATGMKEYEGISGLAFNGCHSGMAKDSKLRTANGTVSRVGLSVTDNNGAPITGPGKIVVK